MLTWNTYFVNVRYISKRLIPEVMTLLLEILAFSVVTVLDRHSLPILAAFGCVIRSFSWVLTLGLWL